MLAERWCLRVVGSCTLGKKHAAAAAGDSVADAALAATEKAAAVGIAADPAGAAAVAGDAD